MCLSVFVYSLYVCYFVCLYCLYTFMYVFVNTSVFVGLCPCVCIMHIYGLCICVYVFVCMSMCVHLSSFVLSVCLFAKTSMWVYTYIVTLV